MLPFVTVGKQMSAVLVMTSHGLFKSSNVSDNVFALPSGFLFGGFWEACYAAYFFLCCLWGFSTYKMPTAVGICLKKNFPFLFFILFSHDNNNNHETNKKKKKRKIQTMQVFTLGKALNCGLY
jgi:hypothetical protein